MKSTAPKIEHLRRQGERLDEHLDALVLAGLAVDAVVPDAGAARVELAEGVAGDDPVEVGVAERSRSARLSGRTSSLAPAPGPSITVASAAGSLVRRASVMAVVDLAVEVAR